MSLTIYTTASGEYVHYAPYFEYCARRAYPKANVRVDILDNIPCPYYAACYRLLNEVPGQHVYITDVDMMLLNPPDMYEFHTDMMSKTGLPYSNSPRRKEFRGAERLTGLHFCTSEWYSKTASVRRWYMEQLNRGEIGKGRFDDELMLMSMAKEVGLAIPPGQRLINLHFGIHLGTIRAYRHKSRETLRHQLNMRITPQRAREWCNVMDSNGFGAVPKPTDRKIREEFSILEAYCRQRARQE